MTLRIEAGLNEPSHRLEIVREATGSPVRMYSVMTECRTSAFLGDKARSFNIDSLRGLPLELYSRELIFQGQEAESPAVWLQREWATQNFAEGWYNIGLNQNHGSLGECFVGLLRSAFRIYSYLFHALFAFFLFGIAVVSMLSGRNTFRFPLLPWEGPTLAFWLVGLAAAGILSLLLAMKGILRQLFFLWSLAVLVLVLRGYFFSTYAFTPGSGSLKMAICVVLAAAAACWGARVPCPAARPSSAK
jgi:hypothetical protein